MRTTYSVGSQAIDTGDRVHLREELGDVLLHPRFVDNRLVYLSYAEAGEGPYAGTAVGRSSVSRAPVIRATSRSALPTPGTRPRPAP